MKFEMITPKELDSYLSQKDAIIVDLRSPDEYVTRHIRGAVNIPYDRLNGRCVFPEEATLVLYCDRGSISMAVAREYAEKGYRTKTVVGGFRAYQGSQTESFR